MSILTILAVVIVGQGVLLYLASHRASALYRELVIRQLEERQRMHGENVVLMEALLRKEGGIPISLQPPVAAKPTKQWELGNRPSVPMSGKGGQGDSK